MCAPLAFHPLPLFLSFFPPHVYNRNTIYIQTVFFFSLLFFSRLFVFAPGSQCTSSTLFKLKSYNSHFVIHQRDSLPRDPMFLFSRVQNSRYTNWKILMRHLFSCTGEREKKIVFFFLSPFHRYFIKERKNGIIIEMGQACHWITNSSGWRGRELYYSQLRDRDPFKVISSCSAIEYSPWS